MTLKARPAGDLAKKSFSYPFENSYDFKVQQKIRGTNILGIIYPQNNWTDEKDEICNGAADNAAAVAVALSAAQNLASEIQAPVALAFWDGEERGLLGSDSFLQNPSFNLGQIVAYINLDIIGSSAAKQAERN